MNQEEILNILTSNEGKYREYKETLEPYFKEIRMADIGYPEIQANTLEEVVKYILDELSGFAPLIIDDSGLFVDTLNGFPGVYSSYVMDTLGCEGILKLMENRDNRDSRFECVIGYLNDEKKLFRGISKGEITKKMRGSGGFGYDPIFKPLDKDKTYAQMSAQEKNALSHRGNAMKKFLNYIKKKRI
ncbi:MAG: XTP/dITP diphosphatase [Thermoplasmata archaeon]